MKKIIYGFSRPIKWKPYAEAIMFVDRKEFDNPKEKFDHGYMRIDSFRWDCTFIYQSSGHAVNFMSGEFFFKHNIAVREYELEISDAAEAEMGHLMVSREGLPYAILQVLGKGFVKILNIISFGKINISNPFKSSESKSDCIEEQAIILAKSLGISVPLDMNTITPVKFEKFIASLPNVKRIK